MSQEHQGKMRAVQQALDEQGVMDIKLFFDLGVAGTPVSTVKDSVAKVLTEYLQGELRPFTEVGDRHFVNA